MEKEQTETWNFRNISQCIFTGIDFYKATNGVRHIKKKKKKISKNPQTAPCPKSLQPQTYWEVDITVELTEGPDHLCEALADSDVQGCALGVVQQVCTGSFSQQHTGNFSLVSGLKQSQRQSRVNPALTENSLCLQSSRTQVLGPLSHTSLLFSV